MAWDHSITPLCLRENGPTAFSLKPSAGKLAGGFFYPHPVVGVQRQGGVLVGLRLRDPTRVVSPVRKVQGGGRKRNPSGEAPIRERSCTPEPVSDRAAPAGMSCGGQHGLRREILGMAVLCPTLPSSPTSRGVGAEEKRHEEEREEEKREARNVEKTGRPRES